MRVGARVALSEEAFGAAVSLGGVGSLAVGGWLMVERGAPARRIAERSAVLFLYTSAINVITLILAGLGLFLGLPGPEQPAAQHRAGGGRRRSCWCCSCCCRATSTGSSGGSGRGGSTRS